MEKLIAGIRASCASGNWYAALYMALAMPDICGGLESPGSGNRARYCAWFDRYLAEAFIIRAPGDQRVYMSADDCWALRNSILHEGNDVVSRNKGPLSKVKFTTLNMHLILLNRDTVVLNVGLFCEAVLAAVSAWLKEKQGDPAVTTRISAMVAIEDDTFTMGHVTFAADDFGLP